MSDDRKIRILCVEDETLDRELIRHALERESDRFSMIEAVNRETFEALLDEGDFDVVLTDFNILGFEGLEVLRRVREQYPGVPIIVVTGTGSEEIAVQALKEGATDYVIKTPRHIAQLPYTIMRAVQTKEQQDRLREHELNLMAIVENSSDGILVVDGNDTIVFSNPAAATLFGTAPEALVGSIFGHSVLSGESFDIDLPLRQGGRGTAEVQVTETMWNGERCRLITLRDITERKRAQEEKEKLEEQLRQSQKLETVGRLAGGVAHDFNNILSVIIGYAEIVMAKLQRQDPLIEYVKEIMDAGERAASLTRQLLAFSRKQPLQPRVLNLNNLVRNIERMLGRMIGEDIELQLELAEDLGHVKADPSQIEQVIMNLAVNARDAMPNGGKLLIETSNVELDEDYARDHVGVTPGRYVLLAMTDTGFGMDKETLSQIFEPFFTTKERGKGTGLGLATVYGIVKQSGGNIWAYSEPGQGTTFKIYLPRTDETSHEEGIKTEKTAPVGSGRILVVEDEDAVRNLVEIILLRLGYEVTTAASADEALMLIEEEGFRPDLVIADVVMPGMTGAAMVMRLQQTQPDIKVLYMSGYTGNAIVHRGIIDPGTPFIQKPFTHHELAEKIEQVLREKA